jgi:glycosyltransferase involved in cell wall biosynthesis
VPDGAALEGRVMDLILPLEHRFLRTPDGAVRTSTSYARPYWDRYLSVFGRVRVVARVLDAGAGSLGLARVDGDCVSVIALPTYVGPGQYLRKRAAVRQAVRAIDFDGAAVLLRAPGVAASLLWRALPRGLPFGVEVISDPAQSLARGAVDHPLRPFFRLFFARELRRLCSGAAAALYVTRGVLQSRYPTHGLAAGISDVDLPEEAFARGPREPAGATPLRLISVAMLEQPYKREDDLLHALALCPGATLTLVGAGRLLPGLRQLARRLGIDARVTFSGALESGAAVRAALDAHDLFVLPSQTEGLPRALVEAMARGLPCIATRVGGIPELLPGYALVPPRQPGALAGAILTFSRDPALRRRAAAENLVVARAYGARTLQPQRDAFLRSLARATRLACHPESKESS